jgi:hypothetical protein
MKKVLIFISLVLSGCNMDNADSNSLPEKLYRIDDTKLICSQSLESFFFTPIQKISENVDIEFLKFFNLTLAKFNNLPENSRKKLLDGYARTQKKVSAKSAGDEAFSFWDQSWEWTRDLTKQTYDDIADILRDSDDNLVYSNFDILKPYWNLSDDDLKKLAEKSHRQLESVSKNFGASLQQSELISTKTAGSSLVQHTYMVKFDSTAIRYVCVFYKPKDTWYVHSINWDNLVSLFFN